MASCPYAGLTDGFTLISMAAAGKNKYTKHIYMRAHKKRKKAGRRAHEERRKRRVGLLRARETLTFALLFVPLNVRGETGQHLNNPFPQQTALNPQATMLSTPPPTHTYTHQPAGKSYHPPTHVQRMAQRQATWENRTAPCARQSTRSARRSPPPSVDPPGGRQNWCYTLRQK